MIEATTVHANGSITPEDSGIWLNAQIDVMRKQVDFTHSQNAKIGIELAHAGAKASTVAPWFSSGATAEEAANRSPDDISMTIVEIDQFRSDSLSGVNRALRAGFDVIELHFADGHLISSFLTSAVIERTDRYGCSFENRTRLAIELVDSTRAAIPNDMPLFVRMSGKNWLDNNPEWEGNLAESLLKGSHSGGDTPLALAAAGRIFMKNLGLMWAWADEADVSINVSHQSGWGFAAEATTDEE
ncbi:hypothetical protein FSARC_14381 [Fusarium sarcochroum]|uniref:NADH:flavin oxidoreductase/NADH oxidase N-terminal domain-containing protein n=1 Tax=Fusarium sarcochroum TaxID=1208366 RepID=A0A8H4SUC8_9HYPO|nr:hypothetical protein FSARC_14381 [Fusarium sarcochroum]